MSAPRRITPPSSPAAPFPRAPIASVPWNLAEFKNPGAQGGAGGFGFELGCSGAELTALREEMQEQHVRAVAEARRAAFEEGRAAGRVEAQVAADRRVVDAVDAVARAAATVQKHTDLYAGVLEENLTALACAIARHVIQREVQLDPSQIRGLVRDAIAEFPQESTLRVRLHPADHAFLTGDSSYPDVTWIADARVERGGCVVEGRDRIVDGRVDLALEQVFRRLTGTDA